MLLFLTLIVGVEIKGSRRWMSFDPFIRFQTVELLKPLFIIFVAKIIVSSEKINFYNRYLYSFLALLLVSLIVTSSKLFKVFRTYGINLAGS